MQVLFAELANKILDVVLEVIKSQPPEVKKQLWEWYVEDITWWRKFLGIEKDV